jgi:Mn-dependent DtxR family transcriptional regulator
MPKTFPIRLEVEEIALGTVLRRLNEMAGIAKIDLDLGHGGKKALPHLNERGNGNGDGLLTKAVAMMMSGPKSIDEISAALGGARSRVYGVMHQLKGKKLVKAVSKGVYQLTDKAMAGLGPHASVTPVTPALPAPVKRGPAGRASPGSGNIILRTVLNGAAMPSSDLRAQLAIKGMSSKSISGVLDRAKRDGLVKLNSDKAYELTAKGHKIELPTAEAAHG